MLAYNSFRPAASSAITLQESCFRMIHSLKQNSCSHRILSDALSAEERLCRHRTGRNTVQTVPKYRDAEKRPSKSVRKELCKGDI